MPKITFSEEEQKACLACVTSLEKDDQFIRERNIKFWKKAEEYWRLNQYIYWDEVALDYRAVTQAPLSNDDENEELPPKTFPIYRAFGESVIAAMSSSIPAVLFFPDDTSNPDDVTTAKAYNLVAELIQKHNKVPLLLIKALALLWNQGLIASHVYWDENKKYGTKKVPNYKKSKVKFRELDCPECGYKLGNAVVGNEDDETNEDGEETDNVENNETSDDKDEEDINEEHPYLQDYKCEKCGYEGRPELGQEFDELIPRLVGHDDSPKGRVIIDTYGPLNCRINSYAKTQDDCGLLELQVEMNTAAAKDEFENIADKISANSDFYTYERWGRTSSELLGDTMFNQVTVRYCWLRPWAFWALGSDKKELITSLKKKAPDGCCVVFVNDEFAEAYDEELDDHWSLSNNTLDSWLHAIPIGRSSLDSQDAYNESNNLNIQKQAFGIKETFVSTDLIDEEAYRQQKAGPGYVTFVSGNPGEPLSNGVAQIKTAELDEEEVAFGESFNTKAQFFSGAVPSIFGGNQTTGSKTAREYELSRAYALQRLGNPWTVLKYWYADTMAKACRLFVEHMTEDEKFTKKVGNDTITVWIKMSELKGKVGSVEPDVNEQFPISWAQKRDLLIQMITMQNPVIGEIMLHPNNSENVKQGLGFPEFYIPGEADRTKQLVEIRQLTNVSSDPDDPNYFDPKANEPTVMPDEDADDNPVHIDTCKLWLVSEEGMFTKETNPAAYLNVVLHKKAHDALMAQNAPQPNNAPAQVPPKPNVVPQPNNGAQ